jgi:hypothetical protein
MLWNKIPKVYLYFDPKNGIPSCFLFREMLRNNISKFLFYLCVAVRNSEQFFLPRNGSEFNSESFCVPRIILNSVKNNHLSICSSIPSSAEQFFCRKLPALLRPSSIINIRIQPSIYHLPKSSAKLA